MLDRLPRLRVIFALLIGIPICWLIAWLIVAALTHTPLSSASELSGLLASIGGIMGAIFTVGGLVIALVAVLSQLTLADQAQRVMQDKFRELLPEFEKRADQRAAARIAFRDAQDALDKKQWNTAQFYARTALADYPELPLVRSSIGMGMFRDIQVSYLKRVGAVLKQIADLYEWEASGYSGLPPQNQYQSEAPLAKTIEWLSEARANGDDPDGEVSAALASMYGITGDYQSMVAAVQEAITANSMQKSDLGAPDTLLMLIAACNNDRSLVEDLGKRLGISLPATETTVRTSIETIGPENRNQSILWYAVRTVQMGTQRSSEPIGIRLFKVTQDGQASAYAYVFDRVGPGGGYQVPAPEPGTADRYLSVEQLVRELTQSFLFICQIEDVAQ